MFFYFILEAPFVLKIFIFLTFWSSRKRFDKKASVNVKYL